METLLTTPMTLSDITTKVAEQSANSETLVTDSNHVVLLASNRVAINGEDYPISDWALAQLCRKLGLPYTYLMKCCNNYFELGRSNFRYWMLNSPRKLQFRVYNGVIIGAVSDKYTEVTNEQVMRLVSNFDTVTDMVVRNHIITPQRLHVRLTEPEPFLDDLYCGIELDNSESGKSSLRLRFFVFKQLCTNGMGFYRIDSKIFAKKHVGISTEDVDSIHDKLGHLGEFAEASKELITASMCEYVSRKDMESILNNLVVRHLLTKESVDSLPLEYYVNRYGDTRWAIANAITEISQQFTLDTRLSLEDYAGTLIS